MKAPFVRKAALISLFLFLIFTGVRPEDSGSSARFDKWPQYAADLDRRRGRLRSRVFVCACFLQQDARHRQECCCHTSQQEF